MNTPTLCGSCRKSDTTEWKINSGTTYFLKPQSIGDANPHPRMGNTSTTVRRLQGFTLIELMIALSLIAILASLALPQFETLILNYRLRSATDLFYSQIVSVRTEAIKRGSTGILCRTGDPLDLDDGDNIPECGNDIYPSGASLPSKDWSYGWLAYATKPEFNGERNYTPSDGDVLLSVSDSMISTFNVTVTSNTAGNSWITYQGDGTLNETGVIHYALCDKRGVNQGSLITIFLDGEARIDALPTASVNSCSPPDA